MDSETCGLGDVWARKRKDLETCRLEDVWTRGHADSRACGLGDVGLGNVINKQHLIFALN